jgi:signal peptidase I
MTRVEKILIAIPFAGIMLIGTAVLGLRIYFGLFHPFMRAFVDPSASMCPTICINERFLADMDAYTNRVPQRGDLVLITHRSVPQYLIKRVIGVPGDVVQSQQDGSILINGTSLTPAMGCGYAEREGPQQAVDTESTATASVKVPPNSFFVVGDNLPNSFDSRYHEFGLVNVTEIRGRPERIYFSRHLSRIGCKIQ